MHSIPVHNKSTWMMMMMMVSMPVTVMDDDGDVDSGCVLAVTVPPL